MDLFSSRNGFQVKKEIQIDSMDKDLRTQLWNIFYTYIYSNICEMENKYLLVDINYIYLHYFKKPVHLIDICDYYGNYIGESTLKELYDFFLKNEWHQIYDFLEFILNSKDKLYVKLNYNAIKNSINQVLSIEKSGYKLVGNHFTRIIDDLEIACIEEAINEVDNIIKTGIIHLKKAFGLLSHKTHPDYQNSIKESISAIETACKIITKKPNAPLGAALNELKKNKEIYVNNGLNNAFEKLYGYTCDSNGIRHALFDKDEKITFDEAKFMLVACSAFFNYLKSKTADTMIHFKNET